LDAEAFRRAHCSEKQAKDIHDGLKKCDDVAKDSYSNITLDMLRLQLDEDFVAHLGK